MSEEQSDLSAALEKAKAGEQQESEAPEETPQEEKEQEEQRADEKQPEEQKPEEKKPEEKPAEQKPQAPKQEPKKQEERQARQPKKKSRAADNVVLVGKKPTMSYVLAAVTQFSDGIDNVHIKARGRSISRAVDVAEVVKNRFVQGVNTQVNIGTDEITDENGNRLNVSTIDIALNK
jgi:DNA-binding protein